MNTGIFSAADLDCFAALILHKISFHNRQIICVARQRRRQCEMSFWRGLDNWIGRRFELAGLKITQLPDLLGRKRRFH